MPTCQPPILIGIAAKYHPKKLRCSSGNLFASPERKTPLAPVGQRLYNKSSIRASVTDSSDLGPTCPIVSDLGIVMRDSALIFRVVHTRGEIKKMGGTAETPAPVRDSRGNSDDLRILMVAHQQFHRDSGGHRFLSRIMEPHFENPGSHVGPTSATVRMMGNNSLGRSIVILLVRETFRG